MYKNIIKKSMLIASVLIVSLLSESCSRSNKQSVVIKGSTTVLPIAQKAAEAFREKNNKIKISISGTGSGDGIKSIIEGHCDIANSSRNIKDKETKKAKEKNKNIEGIVIAYDMIVPVVHPSNKIKKITLDQLKAIYNGSLTNWKQLGGDDKKIVVVSRDTSSGTYEVWHKKVMKKEKVRADSLLQASNGAIINVVAENPNAIGYVGFGYLNDSVHSLIVNNVEPTIEHGKSGKYKISRKLYMFVNKDTISKEAKSYISFLISAEGQALVKEAGFISL
jgi:phosphate transport system substrate-binding protein